MNQEALKTLDLLQIDAKNRTQALELASFIVEAPAGAGKTELLTQRYLKLLATVQAPEEIVALTFTNKAAAEMRNRILQSLEGAQASLQESINNNTKENTNNNAPNLNAVTLAPHKQITRQLALAALQHAQNLGWQLLAQPASLRILTMDALCSNLARQMPLLSRFGGQPIITDDANSHYLQAAQQAIAHIHHEENLQQTVGIALTFMHNRIEKLSELIAKMLAQRDQWLGLANAHANDSVEDIASQVSRAINVLITQQLQTAENVLPAQVQTQLMPIVRFAINNITASSNEDKQPFCQVLSNWQTPLSNQSEDIVQWQALADFLLTDAGLIRKRLDKNLGFPAKDKLHPENETYKQQFQAVTAQISTPQVLQALRSLPILTIDEISANSVIVNALAKLLQLATAELWASFQAANEVDFVQIAQSASYALQNEHGSTDLALQLDYKISHLLIDEFQDTSPTQMQLIELLIQGWQMHDGRTLFCVGDPMQSIYRFRKADVSLFLAACTQGIGQLALTPLKLTLNNRSQPAVVDWINATFAHIFPPMDDKTQAAISYRPFIASKTVSLDEGVQTHAIVMPNDEESSAAKLAEARLVADLITHEQAKLPNQSIAVLVRSRSHLRTLVSVIRRDYPSLRFQAVEIERLNNRQTVLDAYSLCRALLHRADRIHWLNILRAPWCGLTLADLHALASDDSSQTIWQLMHDDARLALLSIDGRLRLAHVKMVLQQSLSSLGRMPLRRLCESTWLKLGGGSTLLSAGDNRDVQAFFDLVEKLARGLSLDFSQLDAAMLHLYAEPDIKASEKLQFITIHKSKGLEFDCVILPALNSKPRQPDPLLMLWEAVPVNNQYALLAAPFSKKNNHKNNINNKSLYDFLKILETERNDNETTRLLYVAATRAVRQLHLVATVTLNKDDDLKPQAKSLLALLWPHVEDDFINAQITKIADNQLQTLANFSPKLMRAHRPQIPDLLTIKTLKNTDDARQIVASITQNNITNNLANNAQLTKTSIEQDAGTLAHLYMEIITNAGVDNWPTKRIAACAPSMQRWLLQRGYAQSDVKNMVKLIITALTNTITSQQGRWVLMQTNSRQSELALTSSELGATDDVGVNVGLGNANTLKKQDFLYSNTNQLAIKSHRIDLTFIEEDAKTKHKIRWIIDYKLTNVAENSDLDASAKLHKLQLMRYAALFKNEGFTIKTAVLFLSTGQLIIVD